MLLNLCRLEKIAEAHRNRVILEAEAESEAIRIKGDAEAFALEARGKAEAEKLAWKAEAYKLYKDAAITQMLLESLPKVMKSKITVTGFDERMCKIRCY